MIASHNSFTYRYPDKLWMCLLLPFKRCQSKTLSEQFAKNNVRLLDIRVRYNKKKKAWYICNGIVTFGDFTTTLLYMYSISNYNKPVKIRLSIEGSTSNLGVLKRILYNFDNHFEFYDCKHVKTGKQLINRPTLTIKHRTASKQSWYGKIFPWLYCTINKKKLSRDRAFMNLISDKDKYITMYDYI